MLHRSEEHLLAQERDATSDAEQKRRRQLYGVAKYQWTLRGFASPRPAQILGDARRFRSTSL